MKMNKSHPTIFWDFDDTLAIAPGLYRSALADALNEDKPSQHIVSEQFRPYLQNGFPWHQPEKPHLHLDTSDKWWENLETVFSYAYRAVGIDSARSQRLAKKVRKYIIEPSRYKVYEDTIPVLQLVKDKGWKQGVLSNNFPELPDIIKSLGLSDYLDCCITSASVGYEKPNPEIYRIALSTIDDPTSVWMIGDNYIADVKGAENFGISAILVHTPNRFGLKHYALNLNEALQIIVHSL